MEPQNHQILLFLSLLFISTTAVSVPTAAPSPTPFPSPELSTPESPTPSPDTPTPSPVLSPNYISFPPSSNLPSQPPSASGPVSTNPALEKICESTDYPEVCISTISPLLTGPTDLKTVVGIAIKAAADHTKLAVSLATKLAAMSSPLASTYGDCKDSYDDAVENFESAKDALATGDVGTMNSMLSAAITDFGDCDDGLLGQSSPLLDVDLALIHMTSNCLAIVSLIH
ncbi:hypothetical protein Vadar_008737 [Vaccinium darrowii]|uniref:Uncharacterized protein n=1 Tax=Vaccinium darrowii TaxID=229202 RepID=A0ACB7XQB6_9ERIC|nr:hypothetical protein Vadar_008737 [Vaccinium darrowii]